MSCEQDRIKKTENNPIVECNKIGNKIQNKFCAGTDIEYQNKIMFNDFDENLIYYGEKRLIKGEEKIFSKMAGYEMNLPFRVEHSKLNIQS